MVFFLYCLKGVGIEYIDIVQFEGYLFSDNVDNEHFFRLFIRFHNSFIEIGNYQFSTGPLVTVLKFFCLSREMVLWKKMFIWSFQKCF